MKRATAGSLHLGDNLKTQSRLKRERCYRLQSSRSDGYPSFVTEGRIADSRRWLRLRSDLAWLRGRYPDAYTIGLEGNAGLRQEIEHNAHEAHICDLNGDIPDIGAPDLMLFLDVLEHLPDPKAVLSRAAKSLAVGGSVIVSLPNVAHLSVTLPLILQGEFRYQDAGILDKTHLQFFVRRSAVQLMTDAGLHVDRALFSGMSGRKSQLLDFMTLGALRTRIAKQLILRGLRTQPAGPVRWGLSTS